MIIVYTPTRLAAFKNCICFRFFYKEKEAVNAKILKDVKFPIVLDVFDLCTPELQKKLSPIRGKYKASVLFPGMAEQREHLI